MLAPTQALRRPALLLDLGGVLVGVEPNRTWDAFADHGPTAAPSLAAAAQLADRLKERAFDLGRMSADEFRAALCAALALELDRDEFERCWAAMITRLPRAEDALADLAAAYDLYLLSNTDPIHFAAARRLTAGWLDRLTGLHLSYAVGLAKPAGAYFGAAIDAFGLAPERCLLLDDRQANLDGARGLGIDGRLVGPGGLTRAALVGWGLLPALP